MIYIILAFVLAFVTALSGLFYKKLIIHPITMSLLLTLVIFSVFSIETAVKYEKEKKEKNNLENPNSLENPFKKIFTLDALKIGLSGYVIFLTLIFAIKKLPLTFVIPLSLIWMVFAIVFGKIMLNIPITKTKIIGLSIIIIGVIFMNYHHFKLKTIDFNKSMIIFLLLFIGTQVLRGYQLTEIKKLETKYTNNELLVMDFGINSILIVVTFIIYRLNPFNKWNVSPLESKKVLILALIILGSVSTFRSYLRFKLVRNMPEILFVLITNSSLIFTSLLAYKYLGESLTWNQFVGASLILFGIFKTNHKLIKDSHHIH